MARTKISEFSATPANNTDIDSINIAEGCAPSGINDAIRELMSQLKDFQTGAVGDSFNGPVGTTTAAAGAFTTLTTSSTVTLNGGTANGVPYLNGSKVLTSGSALTFDGTTFESSIAGGTAFRATATTNTNNIRQQFVNAGGTFSLGLDSSSGSIFGAAYAGVMWHNGNYPLVFGVNNAEAMRLTSTGLGIGTSSPGTKLDVIGGNVYDGNFYLTAQFRNTSSASEKGVLLGYNNANNSSIIAPAYASGSGALAFWTQNGSAWGERMRLDSSGNLGLGVTPSAWGSGFKVIQVGGASSVSDNGFGDTYLASNWRFDGTTSRYINNDFALQYAQENGAHKWNTAPSGTAGNVISFTQAMTLDASGNWLLGATSQVSSALASIKKDQDGTNALLGIQNSSAGNSSRASIFLGSNAATAQVGVVSSAWNVDTNIPTNHAYMYGSNGLTLYAGASAYMTFLTNSVERARIDSSGNLLVGTTAANGKLNVLGNAGGTCASFNANSNTVTPVGIIVGANDTTQAALYVYSGSNGLFNAYIYSNGNLQNRNNSYGGISDVKVKENIVDASPKLADLMQVKVRNYNLIGDTTKQIGVVAQELETVFPAMVDETPDRDEEGNDLGTTTKAVKYSVFVPMLIKAIQEQQAIIEGMKTRLAALESK